MSKIFKKVVQICGHCPNFNSTPIYGTNGCIEGVENICGEMFQKIYKSSSIPNWCPLPDEKNNHVR
jgi:hypothetical protein